MSYILGIDPGKSKGLAYALTSSDTGRLLTCGVVTHPLLAQQSKALRDDIVRWVTVCRGVDADSVCRSIHVVSEMPIWHRPKPSDPRFINPNDLIAVATAGGVAVGTFASSGATCEFVLPNDWKGQRPKAVHNRYVRGLLTEYEAAILADSGTNKSLMSDVLDAIGIAFWKVGRRAKIG